MQMDHLYNAGEEISFRVGYDDVNETLCNKKLVHNTLHLLGVSSAQIAGAEVNPAYDKILRLGCAPDSSDESGRVRRFDPQRASNFWSSEVFVKTFCERRSWMAIFRAFYRVYCLHVVLFHLLMAYVSGTIKLLL